LARLKRSGNQLCSDQLLQGSGDSCIWKAPVTVSYRLGTIIFADLPVPFFTNFPAHAAELEYRKNAWGQQLFIVFLNYGSEIKQSLSNKVFLIFLCTFLLTF
jgi:hypothetical protein